MTTDKHENGISKKIYFNREKIKEWLKEAASYIIFFIIVGFFGFQILGQSIYRKGKY